jgi:spore maturation protein CgeB
MEIRKFKCRGILALKPKGLVIPSIHASMVKAFRGLGLNVLDIPVPHKGSEIRRLLRESKNQFDAGFILDLGVDKTFIQNFKEFQLTSKIPWIIWFVDDPEGYGFPDSCEPEWTHAFCWDREITRRLSLDENWRGSTVLYLPLAADPEVFFPENPSPGLIYERGVFVGSTRQENAFLEEAAASVPKIKEAEDKIWKIYSRDLTQPLNDLLWDYLAVAEGKSKDRIQPDPLAKIWIRAFAFRLGRRKRVEAVSRLLNGGAVFGDEGWREFLPNHYQGRIGYGDEVRAVYNGSSFVLDVRQPQARTGLTQRVFDAGCCGVPVLTEWTPELEVLFDPERELFSYRTIEEGTRKREELLQSIPAGLRRAEEARRRVLRQHTYTHRVRRILEALKEAGI